VPTTKWGEQTQTRQEQDIWTLKQIFMVQTFLIILLDIKVLSRFRRKNYLPHYSMLLLTTTGPKESGDQSLGQDI